MAKFQSTEDWWGIIVWTDGVPSLFSPNGVRRFYKKKEDARDVVKLLRQKHGHLGVQSIKLEVTVESVKDLPGPDLV
jgi:hypothetical protein